MRKALLTLFLITLLAAAPALAADFDCENPPFGATLESLNTDGAFVKYDEKNGISYYNYTGGCVLPIHKRVAPSIVFAFVDGRLYAKIVSYDLPPLQGSMDFKAVLISVYGHLITSDIVYEENDRAAGNNWDVYRLRFGDKDVLAKFKINRVTRRMKTAWYYEPLKDEIKRDVDM